MKKICRMMLIILFLIIGINIKSYAAEKISYKAEYKDELSYNIQITGLEGNEEEYTYSAMICQEKDITASDFLSAFGKAFSIKYSEDTKIWEGNTIGAHEGVKLYGTFEKSGQNYAYIARKAKSSVNYEIIDGPTEIEAPKLPPLGSRIKIQSSALEKTKYSIKVNAHNTMLYNGVQRKVNFYIGEVTDEALLKKLNTNGAEAYQELLQYAKKQEETLKQDSFQDTKTGILDYNIAQNYPIQNGKYYFLHTILDNEERNLCRYRRYWNL